MKMRNFTLAILLIAAVACSKEEAKQAKETVEHKATDVAQKVDDAIDIAVPIGEREDPKAREKERFDEGWRGLDVFRDVKPGQPQGPPAPEEIGRASCREREPG